MEQLALVIFSICIQAAIGMMVFVAIAKLVNKDGIYNPAVVTSAGLAIIGLLASLMHLGRPLSALNSLAQFGSSWLSREIWLTGSFTGLTVLAAILIFFKPSAKSAINALIPIAAVIGLADVYVMASVYNFTSVPAWKYSSIYVEFYAAAVSIGAVLFIALSRKEAANIRRTVTLTVAVAVVLQVAAMVLYYIQLGANESLAAQKSLSILSSMGETVAIKWLLILLGSGLLFFPIKKGNTNVSAGQAAIEVAATTEGTLSISIYIAAALLIVGQIVGRYLFYAIMIISTIGLR